MFSLIPYAGVAASGVVDEPSELDGSRGRITSGGGGHFFVQPYASDPVGSMNLILNGVVPGSVYDVEVASTGDLVLSGTIAGVSITLSIPVYLSGDAKNSIRIKIRKGSASPYYQPYETQAVAAVGTQSIFINQLPDE